MDNQGPQRSKVEARISAQSLECCDLSQPSSAGDLSPENHLPLEAHDQYKKPWPHAPVHKLTENGVYFVTGGTLYKKRLFTDATRLTLLETRFLELASQYRWQVEAWAILSNHYHLVARGNPDSENLGKYLKHLHSDTARELNRLDHQPGRKVWYNFRDTKLTFETSYLARLNYVHPNAVKHGLVPAANQYRWCSAAWFERVATPAMVQTIYSFKHEEVQVNDDY
jgi:putative transposase